MEGCSTLQLATQGSDGTGTMKGLNRHRAVALTLASGIATLSIGIAPPILATASAALQVHIEGHGSPTVVLASGLGDTMEVWQQIQPSIAENCARTFSYNRAGYAGSPPASGPRDAATVVGELRAELKRRDVRPPYVLVGHSLGGLYMQYFAREFPAEVSGLVLVDSTHWNQQLPTEPGGTTGYGRRVVFLYMALITRRELADSARAGEQVRESPRAGNVPTIVLSSTNSLRGETPTSRLTAARLQEEIVADFPAARHVRVPGSGHYIHHDRPDIVIDAARELAGCSPAQLTAQLRRPRA
jgi:pimeloyl-ACP methyl ester carboxylesterase